MARASMTCYYVLSGEPQSARRTLEDYRKFCPGAYPEITPSQALAVRRWLSGQVSPPGGGG